jgi:Na+-transporting NADH:ubiquinone oxidoreductase subunit E
MNESAGWLTVFFSAVFTSNILLTNYLGMCSFLAVSREVKTSLGLGVAVIFVMGVTTPLNWLVNHYVLIPLELDYLRFIVFIVVIAAFTQVVEMVIDRVSESLYAALGIFLPLIAVNCAILGASLFMIIRDYSLAASIAYGVGSGAGWALAILAMAGIRQERTNGSRLPRGLEGPGIALIVAGLMALAFMGFSGMLPTS